MPSKSKRTAASPPDDSGGDRRPVRTPVARQQHSRAGLRDPSDLTDAEWRLSEPSLPSSARRRGHRRAWPLREIIDAIFAVLRAGCAWRLLPDGFPPWPTVYRRFARLRGSTILESVSHYLVALDRGRVGRGAIPTAAVIDAQSGRTTGSAARAATTRARRRRAASGTRWWTTTAGALLLHVHSAAVQDRDGAAGPVLRGSRSTSRSHLLKGSRRLGNEHVPRRAATLRATSWVLPARAEDRAGAVGGEPETGQEQTGAANGVIAPAPGAAPRASSEGHHRLGAARGARLTAQVRGAVGTP